MIQRSEPTGYCAFSGRAHVNEYLQKQTGFKKQSEKTGLSDMYKFCALQLCLQVLKEQARYVLTLYVLLWGIKSTG